MATQIAATPVLHGTEAKKVYKESHKKLSEKSLQGAKKLSTIFDPMMKK